MIVRIKINKRAEQYVQAIADVPPNAYVDLIVARYLLVST